MENNKSLPKSLIINCLIFLNHFWRVFLLIKTCFYVKIAEHWSFIHSPLIVFFLGMFCKLVFCKLQSIRWPSKVTWNIYIYLIKYMFNWKYLKKIIVNIQDNCHYTRIYRVVHWDMINIYLLQRLQTIAWRSQLSMNKWKHWKIPIFSFWKELIIIIYNLMSVFHASMTQVLKKI